MVKISSKIQYPTDRNIIIKLYKKTKEKNIIWHKLNVNKYGVEEWESSEKITNNKSLVYKISHDTKYPELSYISFHLANFYIKKGKKNADFKLIKKIENPSIVLLLLRMALMKAGYKINDILYFILPTKKSDDFVYLLKNNTSWTLPKIDYKPTSSIKDYIKSYLNDVLEIESLNIKKLKYKNITPIKSKSDTYISVIPYVIENYNGEISKKLKINICDINLLHNYYIDDESFRILEYYDDNKLPF